MALEDENNAHGVLLLNSNAMGKTIFKKVKLKNHILCDSNKIITYIDKI